MADPIPSPQAPSPSVPESPAVKIGIALLFLVVVVWFGRGAVVSFFRGAAAPDQPDLTNIPPQVVCAPAVQSAVAGTAVTLTASGGDPTEYKWYAPQGEPFTQEGSSATITYPSGTLAGTKSVVLVSRVRTAKCEITLTE